MYSSREKLCKADKKTTNGGQSAVPNGRAIEMVPLNEIPSAEDLGSSAEVESWLETSSKYHSCEIVDDWQLNWYRCEVKTANEGGEVP